MKRASETPSLALPAQVERRRQQRFLIQLALSIMKPEGHMAATCMTRDLGPGGIYFWADTWDDDVVTFEFCTVLPEQITLNSSVMAKCAATVVRVEREKFSKIGVAARISGWAVM